MLHTECVLFNSGTEAATFFFFFLLRLHTAFTTIDGATTNTTAAMAKFSTLWVCFGWSSSSRFLVALFTRTHWGMRRIFFIRFICESLMPSSFCFGCLPLVRWQCNENRCRFNHCIENPPLVFPYTLFNPIKINDMSWLDRRWKWALHYRFQKISQTHTETQACALARSQYCAVSWLD